VQQRRGNDVVAASHGDVRRVDRDANWFTTSANDRKPTKKPGSAGAGREAEEILEDFPDLERDDILAALEYAAAAVQERELPLAAR